jgi:hypothetical protein
VSEANPHTVPDTPALIEPTRIPSDGDPIIASLAQIGYLIATGRFAGMGIWEPWFYLGAVLFGLSTWRCRRVCHR